MPFTKIYKSIFASDPPLSQCIEPYTSPVIVLSCFSDRTAYISRFLANITTVWIYPGKFVMDKERQTKLRTYFYEMIVSFVVTTTTLPISPKWNFGGVAQSFLK